MARLLVIAAALILPGLALAQPTEPDTWAASAKVYRVNNNTRFWRGDDCLKGSHDLAAPSAPHEPGVAHAEPWSGGGTSLNALGARPRYVIAPGVVQIRGTAYLAECRPPESRQSV